ncbi:hypothetical protein [Noviherbaspirillum sp.]|uniref:hypothetical protein n=1 Tax=Noviherbaspirillum sp. TaxID=1926288 RepID=UPI0025E9C2B8|nr:hypothetical protein [Noviherbaspirillum sp.]
MHFLPSARLLLAVLLAVNGIAMLLVPAVWYATTPGVTETGLLNAHFVRDIGCAYLVASAGFFWLWRDAAAWRAAMVGSLFLVLHALVHVGEMIAGTMDAHHWLRDVPGVFLIPVIAVWLAWPRRLGVFSKENFHAEMDRTATARRV